MNSVDSYKVKRDAKNRQAKGEIVSQITTYTHHEKITNFRKYTKKEMGERSLSMESGHFARNITIILIYGNTNSVNVDYNKIS